MEKKKRTPLFENAEDSLRHGISNYLLLDENRTAIKHAVLNIYHSIELLLKEQLASIHPILIYSDINKIIKDDSHTVGLKEIIVRFNNLGIPLSEDKIKILIDLQGKRNRIEHHEFDCSEDHELVVGQALKFLLNYLQENYSVSLEEFIDNEKEYAAVLEAILTYDERIKKALEDADLEEGERAYCPECNEETVVINSSRGDYCFLCRENVHMEPCSQCGEYFDAKGMEMGICTNCFSYVSERF